MKLILIVALCIAAARADSKEPKIEIVESTFENTGDGKYDFKYKGSDGTARQEHGELRSLKGEDDKPVEAVVVEGEYSWTSPEGKQFTVKFISDEKGYRATGDHIPT